MSKIDAEQDQMSEAQCSLPEIYTGIRYIGS